MNAIKRWAPGPAVIVRPVCSDPPCWLSPIGNRYDPRVSSDIVLDPTAGLLGSGMAPGRVTLYDE